MDNRVLIRYVRDVPAGPEQSAHRAGEQFIVTDAATAKALHPQAEILKYANGQKFVRTQDESLAAEREAEAAEKAKAEAKAAKADADSKAKAKDGK